MSTLSPLGLVGTPAWVRAKYPQVNEWEAVRLRIAARGKDLRDPEKHEATDLANWRDVNTIFCPTLAACLYLMPNVYSLWPGHWHDVAMRQLETGTDTLLRGPRRYAKSAIVRGHYTIKMLRLHAAFMTHICLTPELELEHSSIVIGELENNKRLQEAFNIHPGTISRQDHFEIQVGKAHRTTLKFEWMTRDGDPRGTGRNLLIIDDPDTVDDSPFMCEKYYNKFHTSGIGALEPFEGVRPQQVVACNITSPHCIGELYRKRDVTQDPDDWAIMTVPALELGQTYHITRTPKGESIWPQRHATDETKKKIRKMNLTKARSGDMELLNLVADTGKLIWNEKMFERRFDLASVQPHQKESRVFVDSAQAENEAGDDWAIGRISKVVDGPHRNEYWIEQVFGDSLHPDKAIDITIEMLIGNGTTRFPQCSVVGMESKTTKGKDPWLNDLQKTARRDFGINITTIQLVPTRGKRGRATDVVGIGQAEALRTPPEWDEHLSRAVDQMCTFTGEEGKSLMAVDDLHDMIVWGLKNLQGVELKTTAEELERRREPVKMKNRLAAVGG